MASQTDIREKPAPREVGRTVTLVVPHDAASAAVVRHRVSADAALCQPPEVVDDIALLVTELIGNAVRHARPLPGGGIEVSWTVRPDEVSVRVTDGGSRSYPHRRRVDLGSTMGRGLAIVEMLTRDWGVESDTDCTSVWAVMPCDSARRPAMSAGPA